MSDLKRTTAAQPGSMTCRPRPVSPSERTFKRKRVGPPDATTVPLERGILVSLQFWVHFGCIRLGATAFAFQTIPRAGRRCGLASLSIAAMAPVLAPTCSPQTHPAVLPVGLLCVLQLQLSSRGPWPELVKACRSSSSIRICAIDSLEALPAPRFNPLGPSNRYMTLRSV